MDFDVKRPGFSLVQLLVTVAIVGLLAVAGIPTCTSIIQGQKVGNAITDLSRIGQAAIAYQLRTGVLPRTLDDLDNIPLHDPWVRKYQYTNLSNAKSKGVARINIRQSPINTLFDVYSLGEDGESVSQLTAISSGDDVVWARDGQFIGLASEY